jgi:xanthine dehydrogenase/oxidase
MDSTTTLTFYVNSDRKLIDSIDPKQTILEYLRSNGYVGTKQGCASTGRCGACTIVLAEYDQTTKMVKYQSANACLLPICLANNKQIITVEGLGSPDKSHPVQV